MHPKHKPILWYPERFRHSNATIFTPSTLDLSTDKQAFIGELDAPDWYAGTKTITGVEVRYATNTPGTGTTWRVSLQGITTTPPMTPDGTIAQEWTGAPSSIASGSLFEHTFTTSRVVTKGDRVALVYDYSVFGSGTIMSPTTIDAEQDMFLPIGLQANPAWNLTGARPNCRFVCSDGSRIYFRGWPFMVESSTTTDITAASTGTGLDGGDERGVLWVPRNSYEVSGVALYNRMSNASTEMDICVYRDTTLLASRRFTATDNKSTSNYSFFYWDISPSIFVLPGQNIRLTMKPVVSTVRWNRATMQDAATLRRWYGGDDYETNVTITNRVDGGAWNTPTDADRAFMIGAQFYGKQVPLYGQHVVFR